jgi:hypothetical protein
MIRRGWRQAGPNNFSGRIKSLAIHPSDGQIIYAGAANGGVWKSTDGAEHWSRLFTTQLSFAIGSVAVARSNTNVLYAATGEDVDIWGPSYGGVGVYKSVDAGATWTLTGGGVGSRCGRVVVHASDENHVLVASNTGLYRSMDGGTTWTLVLAGHVTDVVADPATADSIFVAGVRNDGMYLSTDGGATWVRHNGSRHAHAPGGAAAGWIKLAAGRSFGQTTFLAKMGVDSSLVYRSALNVTKWYFVKSGIEGADYNEWTNMIACKPEDPLFIFAGGIGLQRAVPPPFGNWGSVNFAPVGGTHSDHHALVFDPNDSSICYLATDGGVYKSTDSGGNWTLKNSGLIATQLYSIGVYQSSQLLFGAPTQDQGILRNRGLSGWDWEDSGAGNEGGLFVVDENDGDNAYCTPWSSHFVRSTDRGLNWTNLLPNVKNGVGSSGDPGISAIAVRTADSNTLMAGAEFDSTRALVRSTDQGASWANVFTPDGWTGGIAFAPSDGNTCFAVTQAGAVYRSQSAGANGTWSTPYTPANAPAAGALSCVAVAWNDPNVIYIGYGNFVAGNRVRRSGDGGATWQNASGSGVSGSLPAIPINALAIDALNSDTVYAAADIGVFVTRDRGASWQDFNNGFLSWDMPRVPVTGLVLQRARNILYASTMGRGAFWRQL